jgi:hypothetical protein
MPVSIIGNSGIQFPDSSLQAAAASPYTLKNRIINGSMVVDQRNAGASVTPTVDNQYTLDRWRCSLTQSSKFSVQQNAGSVTPPVGFTNYLGVTSLSAYSVVASDVFGIVQLIEGFNTADLAFGTANARTVTLSFWVRSSLTGTFGGVLNNGIFNRSYPFTYTISVANTWEQKTVTITGDTTGTWNTTTSASMGAFFSLGAGSTFSGTAGAWVAGNILSATGATSVVGTNGATFYITGVQLEQNTSATPFERRLYGQELANCQRYFEKSYNVDVVPGTNTSVGIIGPTGVQGATTGSEISATGFFRVTKRATPTMIYYDPVGNVGKCNRVQQGIANNNNSTIADNVVGANIFSAYSASGATASAIMFHYTASVEL